MVLPQTIPLGGAGTVTLAAGGTFTWTRPPGYVGQTSFTYTAADLAGAQATATAGSRAEGRLASYQEGMVPTPAAQDDIYHYGNADLVVPAADGVLANDEAGTFAVLVGSPGSRLRSFGRTGRSRSTRASPAGTRASSTGCTGTTCEALPR